jgi:hypothetical protein
MEKKGFHTMVSTHLVMTMEDLRTYSGNGLDCEPTLTGKYHSFLSLFSHFGNLEGFFHVF